MNRLFAPTRRGAHFFERILNTPLQAVGPALNAQYNAVVSVDGSVPTCQRLLRLPEILKLTGLGKTKIYDLIKKGEFLRPKKIDRASVWPGSLVVNWISNIAEGEGK